MNVILGEAWELQSGCGRGYWQFGAHSAGRIRRIAISRSVQLPIHQIVDMHSSHHGWVLPQNSAEGMHCQLCSLSGRWRTALEWRFSAWSIPQSPLQNTLLTGWSSRTNANDLPICVRMMLLSEENWRTPPNQSVRLDRYVILTQSSLITNSGHFELVESSAITDIFCYFLRLNLDNFLLRLSGRSCGSQAYSTTWAPKFY